MSWPFPLADPEDPGMPPRRPEGVDALRIRARHVVRWPRRRLAIVDTHLPWRISGFRDAEFRELVRQRPDTLAFTLQRTTDPFPRPVDLLADFPARAVAAGVTDVYLVFLNFACSVLGLHEEARRAGVLGLRDDISLWPEIRRHRIRVHAMLYIGGGLLPDTPAWLLREVAARCATVFSGELSLLAAVPDAFDTRGPFDAELFAPIDRPRRDVLRLAFAADDRPRKGLLPLLAAYDRIGEGPNGDRFHLDVVGPHERHRHRLANPRVTWHGWLQPDELAHVYRKADVIVAPTSRDLPEDGEGDTGMVDGFPSTAAKSAMATGCLMVGSNPTENHRIITPGRDYVEVPERDPEALADALVALLAAPDRLREVARSGTKRIHAHCDVRAVVARKLAAMGC